MQSRQQQYEEQLAYLRSIKDTLFEKYAKAPVGMNLNTEVYMQALLTFELMKKFSKVHYQVTGEKVIHEEFYKMLDALNEVDSCKHTIKESLSNEVALTVITKYIYSINEKKVYPSEVRRKEKVLQNSIKRARAQLDAYFAYTDFQIDEVSDVLDMYEVVVLDNGKQVDLHLGNKGFSISKSESSYRIYEYIMEVREQQQESIDLVQKAYRSFENAFKTHQPTTLRENAKELLASAKKQYVLSNYMVMHTSVEQLNHLLDFSLTSFIDLLYLIQCLDNKGLDMPTGLMVRLEKGIIDNKWFEYELKKRDEIELLHMFEAYAQVTPFLNKISDGMATKGVRPCIAVKGDVLKITGVTKKSKKLNLEVGLEQLVDMLEAGNIAKTNVEHTLIFRITQDGIFRATGEQVWTPDVIIFEMMEGIRNADANALVALEKAKDMFEATLTSEEEAILNEHGFTILEGDEFYYALLAVQRYNNVLKIPKDLNHLEQIKALCIHPEDSSVPLYDGFAAIALAVKTGDEAYVLENSNEFNVETSIRDKVMGVFQSFVQNREMAFA